MLPIFQLMDSYLTKQQDLAATSPMTEERNRMARQLAYTLAAHDMRIRHSCRALREKRDVSGYNALRGGRYFFGLTLQNAEESLKELVLQLLDIIDFLGPGNVYLSIYENGSEDDSKDFLVNMDVLLTLFNVDHTIVTDIEGRPHDVDAVEYLAKKRNRALEPLMDGDNGSFDRVVILDGLLFCSADVLELLHEAKRQGADMACGADFRLQEGENEKSRRLAFGDTKTTIDITGSHFLPFPPNAFSQHEATRDRLKRTLPVQVTCCWSGLVALNPRPLVEDGLTFHHRDNEGEEGACGAGERMLLCQDLYRNGWNRVMLVPAAKAVSSHDHGWKETDKLREYEEMQRVNRGFNPEPVEWAPVSVKFSGEWCFADKGREVF
ncbi:unnamed protein product [Vitrella brassicaformis CCMP3155]|uniref:Uncharacterized protein n=1 Tax=Vitrella brassicaformis (strain CCMP3155) TaxID=1169540 RepID=A0A0G4FSC4_VITBC|nr:unnamed protein product [Vitrella brassicaformis CCMP3155]|eukprot:CEM17558.1 unnamed protein product [Vitrella brassicaformis CCMP3155]